VLEYKYKEGNKKLVENLGGKIMYRLEVKLGRKWKLGLNVYETFEEANERAEYMKLVGHKVRIIEDWVK
jgi:hypothetical protein